MGTFNSATFAVNSPYFIAKNITFKVCPPPPFFTNPERNPSENGKERELL